MKQTASVVAALVLCGCVTPYQRMGVTGGYRDKEIAPGRHVVTVRVNGYTDRGTALEYLHRRADELCPNGYELLDRESGDNGNAFQGTSKPELNAIVDCKERSVESAPVAAAPPAFYCAMSPIDTTVGVCGSTFDRCAATRDKIVAEEGVDMGPCAATAGALCYSIIRDGKPGRGCAPTISSCRRRRDAFLEQGSEGAASECEDAGR